MYVVCLFYHPRQLKTVRRSLSDAATNTMVHAFIVSRIDYCNSVLYGVSAVHLRPLQSVLNSAARIILRKQRRDHITADIRNLLQWLPVQRRIEYKMCVLVYKCLHQLTPIYLSELYIPVAATVPHGVTCVQQCKTISSSRTVGQSDMDKEVLPIPVWLFGTHFH